MCSAFPMRTSDILRIFETDNLEKSDSDSVVSDTVPL